MGARTHPRVILVRHGRTALNAADLLRGRLDPELDDVGLDEVAALAEVLAPREPARIVCSPLHRAVQTASAILGDVVSAARRHVAGGPGLNGSNHAGLPLLPIDDVVTKYQINLRVEDRPGVLSEVAGIFADFGVSVQTVEQSIADEGDGLATLIIGTHRAREKALSAVVDALGEANVTDRIVSVLRVEGAQ